MNVALHLALLIVALWAAGAFAVIAAWNACRHAATEER
jgi:hypothetical protein